MRALRLAVLAVCLSVAFCGGSCDDATDVGVIRTKWTSLQGDVQSCGVKCIVSGTACFQKCVEGLGFSSGCSTCWVNLGNCGKSNCILQCLDPSSSTCASCTKSKCFPALLTCSGIGCNALPNCESDSSASNLPTFNTTSTAIASSDSSGSSAGHGSAGVIASAVFGTLGGVAAVGALGYAMARRTSSEASEATQANLQQVIEADEGYVKL